MLHPFNRCELATLLDLKQVESVREALDRQGIEHQVKTRNRNSPSPFALGTRETHGTWFQNDAHNWYYVIYVKRADLELAQACTGLRPYR